ncbi:penicillin-binding transpeptidase domain-containing protein [Candidatus Enterococcus ferrettii]|uniref:Penicillin-binding protein 2X n=1 Tax=Candidatus Enterococcus ferrettii TaxID=2815324 RepID=A0ABV0ETF0_9ENTE|nr:penicillin-binding transpeptidase domain-containing protein [Enterococcus sp. 665A]MBO1342172.1 penicillin-binding protein 2 [Enterococcus sp. 665A]
MRRFKRFVKRQNQSNTIGNRKRVGFLLIVFSFLLFLICAFRISYVVISGQVAGVSLAERTEALYNGTEITFANRGQILDRSGNPLVVNSQQFDMYAILSPDYKEGDQPLYLAKENFQPAAEIISQFIDSSTEEVLAMLEKGITEDGEILFQVELGSAAKGLSLEQKTSIEQALTAKNISGIYFTAANSRSYVNGSFAAHLLGYTTNEDGKIVGSSGLEKTYEQVLAGTDGKIEYNKNAQGSPLPGTVKETQKVADGTDVTTTLSEPLQMQLEQLLTTADASAQAESLTGVLMNAKTGDILAMAQRPTFNPETMEGTEEKNFVWRNLFTEEQYEPGSTIKVGTLATAIDAGVFNPNEVIQAGQIKVEDTTINDHDLGQKGPLTMRQAFSWSSNVGMVELFNKMGATKWQEAMKQMGFGKATQSGLDEAAGSLPSDNIVDLAMSAYGQAISVNQMQMLRVYSAIANKGVPVQPHVVADNSSEQSNEQMFSAEASQQVLNYMRDVVEDQNYGTAYGLYNLEGQAVSAKTGTAQIPAEDGSGYGVGTNEYLYSVGLVYPTEDPQYILYLTMKRPQNYSADILPNIANPLMASSMQLGE